MTGADPLLTIPEVAAQAKVGRATVYRWIAAGLLDRVDVGHGPKKAPKTRISQAALDRFFASSTTPARRPT